MSCLYDFARDELLRGNLSWLDDRIRLLAVNERDYSRNVAKDDFLAKIPVKARVAMSELLTDKTLAKGVVDAADAVFPSIGYGVVTSLVLFKDTGKEKTSTLIAFLDSVAGLPWQAAGAKLTVKFDNGPFRIFRL